MATTRDGIAIGRRGLLLGGAGAAAGLGLGLWPRRGLAAEPVSVAGIYTVPVE
ncbi:BMP family ABC transporter substrate-binding protein, partial [Rhodovulum sulfidophilum]|nr:BMP family ABC transporter substrate-binding protein [Rhodovulum sulfidophilum]